MALFKLNSHYSPSGDQPAAIDYIAKGVEEGVRNQVILGVTGSGKTFTMANIIARNNVPALIMAHNKTLAAQLYSEMKSFFPENAVEYFVSYYDYYQPEAYIPQKDAYIEKDAQINEQIDQLRHSATRALLERKDVIVVSSVSCIYGLGSPELYLQMAFSVNVGDKIERNEVMRRLVELQYQRNDVAFSRGHFRARGDNLDIFPSHYENRAWRISMWGDEVEKIVEFDPLTGVKGKKRDKITVFANSHYVTPRPTLEQSVKLIKSELIERLAWLKEHNKIVEAQRLEQRTNFDLEMIVETGSCKGIENYSRYLSGRSAGEPPPTLFEYLPSESLLFVDESHVTVPQIGGMFNGDRRRKQTLVDYGFRLPSALDNRPLKYDEWDSMRPKTVFVSATPGAKELSMAAGQYVEQIIRPTWLIDPECIVRPAETQVDDLLQECKLAKEKHHKVLVTTLTKKMAEDLTEYLTDIGVKAVYLHSEIHTLERVQIIQDLRSGKHDVLVGVNLLREGLDIPECGLVAILDADKEGFLRSYTSLIQTIGRAARNTEGKVILYAGKMTDSLKKALDETNRRRVIQSQYNEQHGVQPRGIHKTLVNSFEWLTKDIETHEEEGITPYASAEKITEEIKIFKKQMQEAAQDLEFEKAAELRDKIRALETILVRFQ